MKYIPPLDTINESAPFIDGSPEHGIEGSVVPAEAIEHPQREIVEVITQAGLTPSGKDLGQLWKALLKIIKVKVPLATLETPGLVQPDGVTTYITSEGGLLAASPDMPWRPLENYRDPCLRVGSDGKLYLWKKASGPGVAGVGAKDPIVAANATYWLDYAASIIIKSNYEYSRIGTPHYLPSSVLPADYMWADGSLALFADYPDFKKKYDAKGFEGMVLPANATQATKDANLGKFVLNANGTGLYLPRHGGQFMRGWTPGQTVDAGAWGRGETFEVNGIFQGLQGVYSEPFIPEGQGASFAGYSSSNESRSNMQYRFKLSTVNPTGPENVPPHIRQAIAIFMGRHA